MAVVSDLAIAVAAINAGFSGPQAATAVAVALAESGGDTTQATHEADGSTSYGLWQLNSSHVAILASGSWQIPNDNARMAYALFHGRGNVWTDWGAYNNGSYLAFGDRGAKAVNTARGGDGSSIASPGIAALVAAASALASGGGTDTPTQDTTGGGAVTVTPTGWFDLPPSVQRGIDTLTNKNTWIRLGFWILGGFLIVAGFVLLLGALGVHAKAGKATKLISAISEGAENAE